MRAALLLLLVCACFGGGNYLPDEPAPGTRGAKRAARLLDIGAGKWRETPWRRLTDPLELESQPVRLVLAGDGTACPIPSSSPWWVLAKVGTNVPCEAGWRTAR